MATEEQNSLAQELRTALDAIVGVDVEHEIVRETELGALSFRPDKEFLDHVAGYCARIRELQWEEIAPDQIRNVRDLANELDRALDRLKQFNLQMSGSPESYKTDYFRHYQRAFFSLQEFATPLVGALMWNELDLEGARRALTEEAEKARAEVERLNAHIEDVRMVNATEADKARQQRTSLIEEQKRLLTEGERNLEAIRGVSAEAGVEYQAKAFAEAAQRHEAAAKTWLRRTILSGVLTVGLVLAVVYFWGVQGGISEANVLQVVLAKAVVLAVGLYFTFGAGRIYRANAHLAVVNRHREDSLKTFRAFVAGAGDDQETKSKLLLEAAHAAFGQVPTGLAPTKEGGNTLEVLDGATRVIRGG